jgi:hypothetical protein
VIEGTEEEIRVSGREDCVLRVLDGAATVVSTLGLKTADET